MTTTDTARTFTHPDVYAAALRGEPWADPTTDPTTIDWPQRQQAAAIPFTVIDGRPVHPHGPGATGTRYGRAELGHWGEQQCADAVVISYAAGRRFVLLVERADGHGWALPGGYVDPGETPTAAALRELGEEAGLTLPTDTPVTALPARVVDDPRASDEAWMVTTPVLVALPGPPVPVEGRDDARRAEWVRADSYAALVDDLAAEYGGVVFRAHRALLADLLG